VVVYECGASWHGPFNGDNIPFLYATALVLLRRQGELGLRVKIWGLGYPLVGNFLSLLFCGFGGKCCGAKSALANIRGLMAEVAARNELKTQNGKDYEALKKQSLRLRCQAHLSLCAVLCTYFI